MTVIMKINLVFLVWEGKKNQGIRLWCMKRIKKRHAKSLHKEIFEEQLLTEFKQFSNGVISRLEKQNKILTQLISI